MADKITKKVLFYIHHGPSYSMGTALLLFKGDNVMSIGDKVKAIRKQHQMNQIVFANTIGISQGRLSEIEQGKRNRRQRLFMS
ncbi:helix-turn-helix domain-containing protein [Cohnella ginsengisoli]|uniref:helix-turn-helix domain-containing protein n=1 Tax=Cohnella ginsengisoli TaxID=425004 RepID=UPI003B8A8FC1